LMVGYNRRFSPHLSKAVDFLKSRRDPLIILYRVNSGFVPADHWVHSGEEGGGRIIGEVCHFVDAMQYITGSNPIRVFAERISGDNKTSVNSDNTVVTLKFKDGSIGTIVYSASGDRAFSRERIEIFNEGKAIVMDDYRQTDFYESGKKKTFRTLNQQMGYAEELEHFMALVKGNAEPILTTEEIFLSTLGVFSIEKSLKNGTPIDLSR
jgi:predicted dehydrogenase